MSSRNTTLTGRERLLVARDFADFYNAGSSIRDLAQQTGRSYGNVRRLLLDAGVTLRPRSSARIRTH